MVRIARIFLILFLLFAQGGSAFAEAADPTTPDTPPGGGEGGRETIRSAVGAAPGFEGMWDQICSVMICDWNPYQTPWILARKVFIFIFSVIAGVAVCMLIFAGIKMSTSRASEEALGEAKKIAMYALFGLAIAGLAIVIVNIVSALLAAAT